MKCNNLKRAMGVAITMVITMISLSSVYGDAVDPKAPLLWRATSGHVLKAGFVGLKAGVLSLKGEDGQILSVQLNQLMLEDQAVAKALSERMASGGMFAFKPGAKDQLPVFTEGPGKGFFAFYTNANFMVRVTAKAVVTIICLENGQPAGKPILVKSGFTYTDPKTRNSLFRRIVSFDEGLTPVLQPSTLAITGLLQDNVQFGFNLEINGNTIQAGGWAEDPRGLVSPTLCNPAFFFSASHTFGPYVLVVDQKAAVKDLSFVGNPVSGKPFTLQYGDIPKGYNVPLLSAEIKGPVFGSRRVSLSTIRSQAAEMRFFSTGHGPVYGGYEVQLRKKDNAARNDTIRISLTID